MTTMRDSRKFIVREGREAVSSFCSRWEKKGGGRKTVYRELSRGMARAFVSGAREIIWLGCFVIIFAEYWFYDRGLVRYIMEISLVPIFLVINSFLVAIKQECGRKELMHRALEIIDIYETESSTYEADLKGCDCENVEGSMNECCSGIKLGNTWTSVVLAYRDETWQRVPEVLLVEGDIIALIRGDISPGRLRPLSWSEKKSDWIEIEIEIPKGKKVLQEWSEHWFNSKKTNFLQATSPELLRVFGDVKCYRMIDTPLLDYLTKIMSESELHREQASRRTLLRARLATAFYFALRLAALFGVLSFVAGLMRLILPDVKSTNWAKNLFYNPVFAVLCFLPLPLPIYFILGEALMTAHLLLYFGEHMKSPKKGINRHAVSNSSARVDCPSPPMTSMPSMYSHEYDELDVRERITARQKMHSSVPLNLELHETFRVLHTWVSRSLTGAAAVQSDDDVSTEKIRRMMPIPLRSICLVDTLGSVTSFCVLDEEVVCKPYPTVEEVFILNPITKHTDGLTPSHGGSLPYTVLDLHTGEDRDSNSDTFAGTKFEDAQWWTRLPSLKPIGFTCLVAEGKGARLDTSFPAKCSEMNSSHPSESPHVMHGCPEAKLIEFSQQLPSFPVLQQLSHEIGFKEHEDMANFRRVHKIGIIDPRRGACSTEVDNPRVVSTEASWLRGIFNPHVRCHVVQDWRTGSLHCMSEGDPELVLGMCGNYWDGTSISHIPAHLRSTIVEVFRKWTQEDFDVTAFACAPVPYMLTALFCGNDVTCPPNYIVYSKNALTTVGRKPSRMKLHYSDGGPFSTHNTGDNRKLLGELCYSELDIPRVHVLTAGEVARAPFSTFRQYDDVCDMLHDEVFLGMVASGSCPVKAIPCLIEDLSVLGVRFLYFSPRSMRHTKAIADKMGIFTDWNCAISLQPLDKPNTPDPNRMTSTCDWDVNARLPHGTSAIRKHIEEVDNVPLLVPLFTDSTPQTILEMIAILKEYHETVLCIGTGYRLANAAAFEMADLTVVREALPAGQEASTLPLYSERRLSLLDIQFCQNILSLCAALPLRASFPTEQVDDRLTSLTDTIHEGSRVLHNIYQSLAFIAIASTTLGLIPLISMAFPVTIPLRLTVIDLLWLQIIIMPILGFSLLYTPQINISVFNRMPEKNAPDMQQNAFRYLLQVLICALIHTIGVILLSAYSFSRMLEIEDPDVASECDRPLDLPLCPRWNDDFDNNSVVISLAEASEMMFAMLVIGWICYSGCLQYRIFSPFERPPWHNHIWVKASCITVCLQAAYLFAAAAADKSLHLLLAVLSFRTLIFVVVWTFLVCGTVEVFRRYNAKAHIRSQTLLRLDFDTRLGMHSPRYLWNLVLWWMYSFMLSTFATVHFLLNIYLSLHYTLGDIEGGALAHCVK